MTLTHGTRKYERTHGRKPRGRGSWGIEITAWRGATSTSESIWPGPGHTLSEARAVAIRGVKSDGITGIHTEVLP